MFYFLVFRKSFDGNDDSLDGNENESYHEGKEKYDESFEGKPKAGAGILGAGILVSPNVLAKF